MKYNISDLYQRYPELKEIEYSISEAFSILKNSIEKEGTVFTCGNGGSASDADHIVGEFLKSFMIRRKATGKFKEDALKIFGQDDGGKICDGLEDGIRAIALNSNPAFVTAFSNDSSPFMVYAQQLYVLGRKGDVLIGISSSGNAVNVLNALKVAKIKGITSILMTGSGEGKCTRFADCCIKVPSDKTYVIQEYHLPVYHALCAMIEEHFYGAR
ncbi:MAG: SIS domain-containing protein [Victivallales bacterium]